MASYESFYSGADYGLDPNYGLEGTGGYGNFAGYRIPTGDIGFAVDATTANQLDVVSKKLSTGAKVIEVQGLGIMGGGGPSAHMGKIPKQQFEEINRLKKLTGVELTFHGPLVEPTGVSRQGWDETQRQQSEREMWVAVERGQELDPEGNLVITFHSSNGLPEPVTTVIDDETGKPVITQMGFIDEREGKFQFIGPPQKDYFKKDPKVGIMETMKKQNEDAWFRELQHVNFNAFAGDERLKVALKPGKEVPKEFAKLIEKKPVEELYKLYVQGKTDEINAVIGEKFAPLIENKMSELTHADIYLRDAYQGLQNLFNQAYEAADRTGNKKDKAKLEKYRQELLPTMEKIEKDPSQLKEFGSEIIKGITVMRQIAPPERLRPLRDFAIDKASDTFSNVALKSYKKFKDKSPIISVENPPMGTGLARAEDLRELIEDSREKFVKKAIKPTSEGGLSMSEGEAKKQAEKLLGITWDVGHINILRKYGYGEKELISETKKVAPFVKHVHLSDNFGMEHTELPMGMGNVPMKPMLEAIEKYNKQVKKIVETGDWFSRQGGLAQTQTPAIQTLTALGSPLYAMEMGPFWNQAAATSAGYYSGIGATNPQIQHSIYGAGYSNLPVELGGQMAGQSRMGGAPME